MSGFVYFIIEEHSEGSKVKIGYSKDPEKRLKQLKTGNSNTLYIIKTIPGTTKDEIKYHKLFLAYKVPLSREWFYLTPELYEFLYR